MLIGPAAAVAVAPPAAHSRSHIGVGFEVCARLNSPCPVTMRCERSNPCTSIMKSETVDIDAEQVPQVEVVVTVVEFM